ncbi:MAG TPA: branched-chain amino acid ABC transporter permease [Thermodesulfobacteriota bacterium]|nr:branched-chain amino acid ABC transporter permease [Thermodesulfobacteriota bacterium]
MDLWSYIPQLLFSGLTIGAIYALVALGFVTISRASQIINFAQGEFVMLGGVITYFLLNGAKLPYPLAALIAILIVMLIGFAMHLSILYPLRKASVLILIMATLGASIFLSSTSGLVFGTLPKTLPPFSGGEPLRIGKISFPSQSLWVLLSTFILLIFLYLLSHRTLLGKAMEASSTDPLGADLLGISRNLMVFLAFGVSAGVGAFGGILITPVFFTSYSSGALLGLKGFIAAVLGGWGKNTGAILGGFVLGIVESLSLAFIPSGYKDGVAFVILLFILYFRPKGILGSPFIDSRRW